MDAIVLSLHRRRWIAELIRQFTPVRTPTSGTGGVLGRTTDF